MRSIQLSPALAGQMAYCNRMPFTPKELGFRNIPDSKVLLVSKEVGQKSDPAVRFGLGRRSFVGLMSTLVGGMVFILSSLIVPSIYRPVGNTPERIVSTLPKATGQAIDNIKVANPTGNPTYSQVQEQLRTAHQQLQNDWKPGQGNAIPNLEKLSPAEQRATNESLNRMLRLVRCRHAGDIDLARKEYIRWTQDVLATRVDAETLRAVQDYGTEALGPVSNEFDAQARVWFIIAAGIGVAVAGTAAYKLNRWTKDDDI